MFNRFKMYCRYVQQIFYKDNFFHITLFVVNSTHTRDYMQRCFQVRSEMMYNMSVQSMLHKNCASNVFLLFDVILWAVKLFSVVFSKKSFSNYSVHTTIVYYQGCFHTPSYAGALCLRLKSSENTMICHMIQFQKLII